MLQVVLTGGPSSGKTSVINRVVEQFKEDATALGFTLYKEASGELSSLYSSWGV